MKQELKHWSDIQIAFLVAKHGTLSKAATELEVHHSTVLRHIDAIEERLGCKLFHRHPRGYTPTDAGKLLFEEAQATEQRLERLVGKLAGQDQALSGPLVLTTVSTLSPYIMPVLQKFKQLHPQVRVELLADSRIFKLEYGEAHISLRPGQQPTDGDYVVQHFKTTQTTFYGSSGYIKKHGTLSSLKNHKGHKFLNLAEKRNNIPSIKWINENVPQEDISFIGSEFAILAHAAMNGLGLVPMSEEIAKNFPELIAVMPPPKDWNDNLWLVTHRDIHHSPKVQAFTKLMKEMLG
jgi:DNA-binding transcriptional LysR family regulator